MSSKTFTHPPTLKSLRSLKSLKTLKIPHYAKVPEPAMTPGCAETEPPSQKGHRVAVVDEQLIVYKITRALARSLYADAIPMIGLQKVVSISILLQQWRLRSAVIATEAGGGVPVAAIAQIVELQRGCIREHTVTLPHADKWTPICHLWVSGQPEAVEVRQAVGRISLHHHGLILNHARNLQGLTIPEREACRGENLDGIGKKQEMTITAFGLHLPQCLCLCGEGRKYNQDCQ